MNFGWSWTDAFALVGLCVFLHHYFQRIVHQILALLPEKDLRRVYGDGCALIVDACDGIGLQFAQEFAARGINVCLSGPSRDQLHAVRSGLAAKYPQVKVDCLQLDLLRAREPGFLAPLEQYLLSNLDVSMFVFASSQR